MNNKNYFYQIYKKYGNGFWINNPTLEETDKAIAAGSINCTTNPSYVDKMYKSNTDRERVDKIINELLTSVKDESEILRIVQRKMIIPLLKKFEHFFENSSGTKGFISIQGDPLVETDPDMIIKEALEDIKLGKNVIIKIPVTEAGLIAIDYLVKRNIPIVATEIMSISQAISVCETYKNATFGKPDKPALYVTHITGIFDDYISIRVKELGLEIPKPYLLNAGLIIARKQYELMQKRQYPGIMLGGGARALHHFTGLVGAKVDITINWSGTADRLLEEDIIIKNSLKDTTDPENIKFLLESIPEYRSAFELDALDTEDFESFGPVVLFRDAFTLSWQRMLDKIKEKKMDK